MDHQNLSEHVLCMVLYLIELGLENSPEQESDEEVRINTIVFVKIQNDLVFFKIRFYHNS